MTPDNSDRSRMPTALKIPLVYLLVGGAWIAFSDLLLRAVNAEAADSAWMGTLKGWLFIAATAWMLHRLLRREAERRRTADEAVRAGELRYRRVVTSDMIGIAFGDDRGGVTDANDAFLRMIGWTRDDLAAGRIKWNEITPPEYLPLDIRAIEQVRAAGISTPFEKEYLRRDGTRVPVLIGAAAVDGAAESVVCWVLDISERVRARQALAESERRLRAIFDSEPQCVKIIRTDGTLVDMNPAGLAIIEADGLAAVRGRQLTSLVTAEHREAFHELTRRAGAGEPGRLRFEIVGLRGTRRWLETHAIPFRDGSDGTAEVLGITRDVTLEKRADELLRESEKKYRDLVETSNDLVWAADGQGRMTFINRAAVRIFGWSPEEVLGRRFTDFQTPGQAQRDMAEFGRMLAEGNQIQYETEVLRSDGTPTRLMCNSVVIRGPAGEVLGATGFATDITERKRAEEALRREKDFSDALIDSLPGNFYLFDAAGKMLRWNRFVRETSGYTDAEIAGMPPLAFIAPEDAGRVAQTIGNVFEKGHQVVEANLLSKAGVRTPFLYSGLKVMVDGRPHLVGLGVEISDRKRAEKALQESERRYPELFDAHPLPMWVYDSESLRFLAVNDAAVRHYGYSRQEFLSMTTKDIRPPEEVPRLLEHLAQVPAGIARSGSWTHRRKDGTPIEAETVSHSVVFGGRPGRLVSANDVTERKRLEEQLRQSQKMEAVGRLAGGVAHDFNNLLSGIIGFAELAQRNLERPADARRSITQVIQAGMRAAELVGRLLAFSRKQVLQPRVLDLNSVIEGISAMLRRLIRENIELVFDPAPQLGRVRADPGQIEHVIVNLAVNARDAMPRGGRLTISTADVPAGRASGGRFGDLPAGDCVMLEVRDDGSGMDATTLSHLFEPFFTTKEAGRGTGLGLATVYGVVKQSGGGIDVESEVGRGTTFRIYLPRVPDELPVPVREPAADELPRGTETILVVEDSEMVRSLLVEVLGDRGYTVLAASDGAEALRICGRPEPIDLMLTDMVMPGFNGRELAEAVARTHPEMRVVFMSGYTDDIAFRDTMEGPGAAFLQKPFTEEILTRRVREVLDGPRPAARPPG